MSEVETDIEGLETEVNSLQEDCKEEKEYDKNNCNTQLKEILKRLKDNCDRVAIFIRAGSKCCKQIGCICDVDDCFVVLMNNEAPCDRTHILLDCICAVENCVDNYCFQSDDCK